MIYEIFFPFCLVWHKLFMTIHEIVTIFFWGGSSSHHGEFPHTYLLINSQLRGASAYLQIFAVKFFPFRYWSLRTLAYWLPWTPESVSLTLKDHQAPPGFPSLCYCLQTFTRQESLGSHGLVFFPLSGITVLCCLIIWCLNCCFMYVFLSCYCCCFSLED